MSELAALKTEINPDITAGEPQKNIAARILSSQETEAAQTHFAQAVAQAVTSDTRYTPEQKTNITKGLLLRLLPSNDMIHAEIDVSALGINADVLRIILSENLSKTLPTLPDSVASKLQVTLSHSDDTSKTFLNIVAPYETNAQRNAILQALIDGKAAHVCGANCPEHNTPPHKADDENAPKQPAPAAASPAADNGDTAITNEEATPKQPTPAPTAQPAPPEPTHKADDDTIATANDNKPAPTIQAPRAVAEPVIAAGRQVG
jgi:hypothetical protein